MKIFLTCLAVIVFGADAFANNMLVQNVTTLGNNPSAKTIQVQFDLSWDNSWRDSINYDAAWIFIKFKDANGLWQHAQLNQTGFVNGTGTANMVQVTADKVGAWVYRTGLGSGTFSSTSMQIQWNYGLSGLNAVTGLELKVFAVEMVYVPEGSFSCAKDFDFGSGSQGNLSVQGGFPIINKRLSPSIFYSDASSSILRIKGDSGIDRNNDGVIDVIEYPTGFFAFYYFKYELTEQQYADFLNTLTSVQVGKLGVAGNCVFIGGEYRSASPNLPCGASNFERFFAYADWAGIRPATIMELNKASYGPVIPAYIPNNGGFGFNDGYPAWGSTFNLIQAAGNPQGLYNVGSFASGTSTRETSGSSYYGIFDLTYNAIEPVISLNALNFGTRNGDGNLLENGLSDIENWQESSLIYVDQFNRLLRYCGGCRGFRFVRSAE